MDCKLNFSPVLVMQKNQTSHGIYVCLSLHTKDTNWSFWSFSFVGHQMGVSLEKLIRDEGGSNT